MWEPLTARLASHGREVTPLELPGHGRRPRLRAAITLTQMADDVGARLPARAHLVGFSLGALVAQELALKVPERVSSLMCVSSVCRRTPEEAVAVRARLDTAATDFRASAEAALLRWFPEPDTVPNGEVEKIRAVLLANDPVSYLHAYEVFASGDRDIAALLPSVSVPTLALTGSEDPGSTPEMTRRLARLVPGARSMIFQGARHMLPIQQPEELARVITEFAAQAERTVTHA